MPDLLEGPFSEEIDDADGAEDGGDQRQEEGAGGL
jgi:hypothetical protein